MYNPAKRKGRKGNNLRPELFFIFPNYQKTAKISCPVQNGMNLYRTPPHANPIQQIIGSLSKDVFKQRSSTGSGLFAFFGIVFAQIFRQIAPVSWKNLPIQIDSAKSY